MERALSIDLLEWAFLPSAGESYTLVWGKYPLYSPDGEYLGGTYVE